MAGSLNRVTLIGNLGADPEIRTLNSGNAVANFSLATTESWKKDGEKHERTEWHRVVVWSDGLIEVIEKYVKKGSKLMVEGQLQTRKWQDQDGNDRYSTEVVLSGFDAKLLLLGDPRGGDQDRDGGSRQGGGSRSGNGYGDAKGRDDRGGGRSGRGQDDGSDRGRQDSRGNFSRDVDDDIPF